MNDDDIIRRAEYLELVATISKLTQSVAEYAYAQTCLFNGISSQLAEFIKHEQAANDAFRRECASMYKGSLRLIMLAKDVDKVIENLGEDELDK